MYKHHRFYALLIALFTTVMMSGLSTGYAQPDALSRVAQTTGQGEVVVSDLGIFSIRLPQTYVTEPISVANFADSMVFGDTAASEQAIIDLVIDGNTTSVDGIGGFVGAAQLNGQDPSPYVSVLMQSLVDALSSDIQTTQPTQAHTFGGQYPGELATLSNGYLAVMHSQDQLVVAILISDDLPTNRAAMSGLLETIRTPAEPPMTEPRPTNASPPTAQAQDSDLTPQTVRSSDDQVSLVLPGEGTVLDYIADDQILAYGDSDTAAQSRLYSAKPDLAPKTALSGSGGVIILYSMDRFGIDPQNPDLAPLMQQALAGLTGYTVEQAAQPLEGSSDALVAVIASGVERGYLALIPFGDQIAYVTATTLPANFESNAPLLLEIIKSVRVPADTEESGLGGLSGLESTPEVTVEPTEEIGGLSGL